MITKPTTVIPLTKKPDETLEEFIISVESSLASIGMERLDGVSEDRYNLYQVPGKGGIMAYYGNNFTMGSESTNINDGVSSFRVGRSEFNVCGILINIGLDYEIQQKVLSMLGKSGYVLKAEDMKIIDDGPVN